MRLGADARRILLVQALRAFVYGLGSVLIGVTLADLGLSGVQVGLVLGALVAGTALVSILLARLGDRVGRRRWYLGLLVVMALAGAVFALTDSVWLLVLAALTGTVSTEVVESGPFTSLEQAMLPDAVGDRDPTRLFGTYNTIATLAGSLGALAALATRLIDVEPQRMLLAYPVAAAAAIVVAARLSTTVEARATEPAQPRRPLERSRGVVARLSRSVRARLARRRLRDPGVPRLLVHRDVGHLAGDTRGRLLRRRHPPGRLLPDRGPPRRPHRTAQHDGVHPPTVEPPPGARSPSPRANWPRSRSSSPASRSPRWTSPPARHTSSP